MEQELLEQRLERIREIQALGYRPYGQRFDFTHTIPEIRAAYEAKTSEDLAGRIEVRICGRLQTIRRMGKAGFAHLLQNGERLQIYVRKDSVAESDFQLYQLLDAGDIIGAEGYLFRTRTGELTVHVERLHFLAKTLLSMPEKWHGLEDVETRYRQRYLDLIANPEVRRVFVARGADHRIVPPAARVARVPGGRDADDAAALRRRGRPALCHASQHPGHGSVPAHRAGAVPEAPGGGRAGAGLRDQPELPQRGDLDPTQPRVHHAGVLPGLHRLPRPDGSVGRAAAAGRARRDRLDGGELPGAQAGFRPPANG